MEHNALHEELEHMEHEHHHEHEHDHEHHHHDHDEHDEHCTCGCHNHDHDDDEHEHHQEHEHEHDEHCTCGCHDHEHDHDHEHHHHHHADEVFTSWGMETPRKFTESALRGILSALEDEAKYGVILRAKGIVDAEDGDWLYFDYVPGEVDIRRGGAAVTGRFCVIGSKLNEQALKELFEH